MNETDLRVEMKKWLASYFSWEDKVNDDEVVIAEDGWWAGFNAAERLNEVEKQKNIKIGPCAMCPNNQETIQVRVKLDGIPNLIKVCNECHGRLDV